MEIKIKKKMDETENGRNFLHFCVLRGHVFGTNGFLCGMYVQNWINKYNIRNGAFVK